MIVGIPAALTDAPPKRQTIQVGWVVSAEADAPALDSSRNVFLMQPDTCTASIMST